MCEKGHWLSDDPTVIWYQDKYGRHWNGPKAQYLAEQEAAEYEACLQQERQAERNALSGKMAALAGRPLVNDWVLEQPESLHPIVGYDFAISNDRLHWRPGFEHVSFPGPRDWMEIPPTAQRVAVIGEHLWRVAYRLRGGDERLIWSQPLAFGYLSRREHRMVGSRRSAGLDAAEAPTDPWEGLGGPFSTGRMQWRDPWKGTYVYVRLHLKRVGVADADFWRVVLRDKSSHGTGWVSQVSMPLRWQDLSQGEQESFRRKPLGSDCFQQ